MVDPITLKLKYSDYFVWSRPSMSPGDFIYFKRHGKLPPLTDLQKIKYMEGSRLNLNQISHDFNEKVLDEETMFTLFREFSNSEELNEFFDGYLGPYCDPWYEPEFDDIFVDSMTKYLDQFEDS